MGDQLNEMQLENDQLTEQLSQFSNVTIDKFVTIKECEVLEQKVKGILHNIEQKKVRLS